MSNSLWLLAAFTWNGWTIAALVIVILLLVGILWNIKDILRYIRISRM